MIYYFENLSHQNDGSGSSSLRQSIHKHFPVSFKIIFNGQAVKVW